MSTGTTTHLPPRCWLHAAAFAAALAIGGCATRGADDARASPGAATTFVLLRHAEKAADDPKDPSLSETGQARAARAGERLAGRRLVAAYATAYRRTRMTAAEAARAHGLAVVTYDAAKPAAEFASELRRAHPAGVVLVVGHSNTVADIAGALCACAVTPLREDEYDRWIEVRIGRDGAATLEDTRY